MRTLLLLVLKLLLLLKLKLLLLLLKLFKVVVPAVLKADVVAGAFRSVGGSSAGMGIPVGDTPYFHLRGA